MNFGILLAAYTNDQGFGNYAVTFIGTLQECRGLDRQNGETFAVSKAEYNAYPVEPKTMHDQGGNPYSGDIVRFVVRGMPTS